MAKPVANGSNVFLWNDKDELLVQAMGRNYPTPGLLMWPGGRMNPGNRPREAAARELREEAGLIVDWRKLRPLGYMAQAPTGQVFICDGREFEGELRHDVDGEIGGRQFMSVPTILANRDKFHRSYLYMFIQYMRCIRGLDSIPCEGRISEAIEWPACGDEVPFILPAKGPS
jgi:8-oxo-dGTP pyrophosphatase MutT (NUDIX family)